MFHINLAEDSDGDNGMNTRGDNDSDGDNEMETRGDNGFESALISANDYSNPGITLTPRSFSNPIPQQPPSSHSPLYNPSQQQQNQQQQPQPPQPQAPHSQSQSQQPPHSPTSIPSHSRMKT